MLIFKLNLKIWVINYCYIRLLVYQHQPLQFFPDQQFSQTKIDSIEPTHFLEKSDDNIKLKLCFLIKLKRLK